MKKFMCLALALCLGYAAWGQYEPVVIAGAGGSTKTIKSMQTGLFTWEIDFEGEYVKIPQGLWVAKETRYYPAAEMGPTEITEIYIFSGPFTPISGQRIYEFRRPGMRRSVANTNDIPANSLPDWNPQWFYLATGTHKWREGGQKIVEAYTMAYRFDLTSEDLAGRWRVDLPFMVDVNEYEFWKVYYPQPGSKFLLWPTPKQLQSAAGIKLTVVVPNPYEWPRKRRIGYDD